MIGLISLRGCITWYHSGSLTLFAGNRVRVVSSISPAVTRLIIIVFHRHRVGGCIDKKKFNFRKTLEDLC